jgi:uncharacterized protein (DUF302 family)
MKDAINFKREIQGTVDGVIAAITESLKQEGFGILTRIDLHEKFREKLGKEVRPVVILGACNPQLAYEAFQRDSDFTSLIPCNAVVRDLGGGKISLEIAKPSAMMEVLGNRELVTLACDADARIERAMSKV